MCCLGYRDEPVVLGVDRLGRLDRPCGSGGADAWLGVLATPRQTRTAPKAAPKWTAAQWHLSAGARAGGAVGSPGRPRSPGCPQQRGGLAEFLGQPVEDPRVAL